MSVANCSCVRFPRSCRIRSGVQLSRPGDFFNMSHASGFSLQLNLHRDILRVKLEGPTLAQSLLLALHLRGALSEARRVRCSVTIRNWMKMLLAVLLGNLAYFLLAPHLPNVFAH